MIKTKKGLAVSSFALFSVLPSFPCRVSSCAWEKTAENIALGPRREAKKPRVGSGDEERKRASLFLSLLSLLACIGIKSPKRDSDISL